MLTVGIAATFDVTVSVPASDGVLPARFVASQWYMPECCSFVTERRTKYKTLPFWIREGFKRTELSFNQVISGRGEPVAAHLKVALLPSSTATSLGCVKNTGFQITVVKNVTYLIYYIFSAIGTEKQLYLWLIKLDDLCCVSLEYWGERSFVSIDDLPSNLQIQLTFA